MIAAWIHSGCPVCSPIVVGRHWICIELWWHQWCNGGGEGNNLQELSRYLIAFVQEAVEVQLEAQGIARAKVKEESGSGKVSITELVISRVAALPGATLLGLNGKAGRKGVAEGTAYEAAEIDRVEASIAAIDARFET